MLRDASNKKTVRVSLFIFNLFLYYSNPKTWAKLVYVEQINTNLIKVIPIIMSLLIYYILYKWILKVKITTMYGFSKARTKNIFIGILIGVTLPLLGSLILSNQVWYEFIYRKGFLNLVNIFNNRDVLIIIRNTLLANVISILMAVIVPFFEEILFRGLVFNKLRATMSLWAAIILQALLFGICQANVLSGVYAFIIGILLGIIYVITKSIWVPVIIRVIFNISIMAMKEFALMSSLLEPSTYNPTEVIDTFVYNSHGGNTPNISGMPIMANIILGTLIILLLVAQIIWLWRSNHYFTRLTSKSFLDSQAIENSRINHNLSKEKDL